MVMPATSVSTSPLNTAAYGVFSNVTGVGTGTNYGMYVNATGSVTHNYGLYIANPTAAAGNYGIYENSTAQNYFNGNVGIGSSLPAAKLDVFGSGDVAQFGTSTLTDQYIKIRPNTTGSGYFGLSSSLNGGNGSIVLQGGSNKTLSFTTNSDTFASTPQMGP